jgi:tetratricopeptide (TPR) repeat protein
MNDLLLNAAVAEFESGHYASCAHLCRIALESTPTDEKILVLLAMALHGIGQVQAAADVFAQLIDLSPDVGEHHANLGLMLHQLGRHEEAETSFKHALSLPHAVDRTLVNYGLLLQDLGRVDEARHVFLDACELGDLPEARVYAAIACLECGDARRIETLVPDPSDWPRLGSGLRSQMVRILVQIGRVEEAEAVLVQDASRQDPTAMISLAMLHERTNRLDSAKALLAATRQLIDEASPLYEDVLLLEAALALRDRDYPRARQASAALLEIHDLPASARSNAHFMLAGIADKLGDTALAMQHLASAHQIELAMAPQRLPGIADSADEPLQISMKWLTSEQAKFPSSAQDPSREASPVFIVGFPRSGTTMLEQMLDAHPDFASMDERIVIQYCVEHMESKGLTYPDQLDQLTDTDLAEMRALYWAESGKVAAIAPGQTLVDKNPLNMLRLPMIVRLFPSARIILALRHPCDVILSCYMQNFRSPAFMVLCSTLERLAKSYVNAMRFWIHHQALLGPDTLVLRYEDTVAQFDRQVHVIGDYLGITDHAPLSEFAAHAARKGYISTPSYAQVTEAVNTRAVARWEPYRAYFEPVFPLLQPVADHWGYALDQT